MATTKGRNDASLPEDTSAPAENLVPNNEHPDYLAGRLSDADDAGLGEFTPNPDGPLPPLPPGPRLPDPLPFPIPLPEPGLPRPIPIPGPGIPFPVFCSPVSGRYRHSSAGGPMMPPGPPLPIWPINLLSMTVRVDVDRFYPQNRISIQVNRLFPNRQAHVVAEVTSDVCSALNRRIITANIVYRDGDASLIPGTTITFSARRTMGIGYGSYQITLSGGGIVPKTYALTFESVYFDKVEFEVDRVDNAGTVVTSYDTASHPNRPASLPSETLSLATVYRRAGFDATMSSGGGVIPRAGAGTNGTWSDAEMHNAMVTYWSRFANNPQWAMWVLYAARHDMGRNLGGIMFDDIGPNHRQGTAIFTDSFIQDVPPGTPSPAAWRNRMQFWTAIHEMGHAFNLAHSWQKALGTPWIPLANEPEARSFMNYPYHVSGGQASFFADFQFRFSDSELVFMRHAPRRFVQMGNSNWFDNHGFEEPDALRSTGDWKLAIRPNRAENTYRFLEPVTMELKLSNTSGGPAIVDHDMLADGRHVTIFIQREGGSLRQLRSMITRCHKPHGDQLEVGKAVYGAHMISTSTDGWLIDEPGFYKVQAAIDVGNQIVVSNVMRLYVTPPASAEEAKIAGDYFTEDVGRVLAFAGAPQLANAEDVLRRVIKTCAGNPAAVHAAVALSNPMLRDFKLIDAAADGKGMKIVSRPAKVEEAAKIQLAALLKEPEKAADTVGNIPFFGQLQQVADSMKEDGNEKGALDVMTKSVDIMKTRKVLPSVIEKAERQIKRRG
jgi:hypothetical protein